jgi:hypothetical protein
LGTLDHQRDGTLAYEHGLFKQAQRRGP